MGCFLGAAAFLLVAVPVWSADEAKPNRLTPREVADGWLLLFDGVTTFGWQTTGAVTAVDGLLTLGGDKDSLATPMRQWGDFELLVEYRKAPSKKVYILVQENRLWLEEGQEGWKEVRIQRKSRTVSVQLGMASARIVPLQVDSHQPLTVGFGTPSGTQLLLRNLKLRPLGLQSIFNGKDLTGWKEFPGRKSKFTVTPEGLLNIKDGPGDLQTEGQWGDFVLQLDCISNGKHLNSGVFFRCRPDEYQQGYEAQIRNQFTPEPTQEYTLELYDPKTGQLTDKQKVKYTAVDYGTGAIYRRQPARREVAKDGEWFTMTVVAHSRHMAVWVNGIQVTDWTDNRPLRANAREGCRLEKGPISLQGHDPTTDLSFRNFRIAELPAAKND